MIRKSFFYALIVDDEPIARRLIETALQREGFFCDHAQDGFQATRSLAIRDYDLVVLDLLMPKKHGHAVAVDLLANSQRPVIIIHTVLDDLRLMKDLLARGVDDFVHKPTDYKAFAAKAKLLVERQRRKQEQPETESTVPTPVIDAFTQTTAENSVQRRQKLEQQLTTVDGLSPFSLLPLKRFLLSNQEGAELRSIAQVIECDASLTAQLLRLGNDARYNPAGEPVLSIEDIVDRVGRGRAIDLAVAIGAHYGPLREQAPWMNFNLAWKRSLAAGIAMRHLASVYGNPADRKALFLSAIFHPLGHLVLATVDRETHRNFLAECYHTGMALDHLHQWSLGITGSEVTARLLRLWKIPAKAIMPLIFADHRFSVAASLREPHRTEVMLVKLAILLGRIAVGRWEAWDTVDIPNSASLQGLSCPPFASVLAHTQVTLETLLGSLSHSEEPSPSSARPIGRRIGYVSRTGEAFDFLAAILPSLGIDTTAGDLPSAESVLLNGLHVESSDFEAMPELAEHPNLILATTSAKSSRPADSGKTLAFPTSYARLGNLWKTELLS